MNIIENMTKDTDMDKMGQVAYTDDSFAYVKFERVSSCGDSCASCSGDCAGKEHLVKVYNKLGAQKGDLVEVTMDGGDFLKMTFMLYGIPLIVMVLVIVALEQVMTMSIISPLLGILASVGSFFLVNAIVNKKDDSEKTPVHMRRVMKNLENI